MTRRSAVLAFASLALTLLVMLFAWPSTPAFACTTGGSGCLPGAGYTGDSVWPCPSLGTGNCHEGTSHSWGWGSADGPADTYVCIQGSAYYVGCAYGLARACYYTTCDDQDLVSFALFVRNQSGFIRTLSGHGKY